jgi:hypothetical protein
VVPFHREEVAVGHRNQAGEEVRPRTYRTERVRRLCFSAVLKVQAVVIAMFRAAAEPRLRQLRQGREGRPGAHSHLASVR